jgi:basic membrane protein A
MQPQTHLSLLGFLLTTLLLSACGQAAPATPTPLPKPKVAVLLLPGAENDKGFNQYTLQGAREGAESAELDFIHKAAPSPQDFGESIQQLIADGTDLIIMVGFDRANDTTDAARKNPGTRFAIIDNAFAPGFGCPEHVKDCYTEEGGLANVTSLMFAEDEAGYLAGVLASCMSQTGTIASVAGVDFPPVVRFVEGYQHGARSVNPDIKTLNRYIPDFDDPETGLATGAEFISQGADVIFGVGGQTGNGGLLAAKNAGLMAIGVDVDQYFSYPEVKDALLTSAMKNVDVATGAAVKDFAAGTLTGGIRLATVASGGVGLAPYHDWESKIPQTCKDKVTTAAEAIKADPTITGSK